MRQHCDWKCVVHNAVREGDLMLRWKMREVVIGAVVAGFVLAARGQTAPAGATMVLDYHDVPVDTILTEVSKRLEVVVIQPQKIQDPITLESGKSVDAVEAG